ncbi:M48 family metallopeptidase [Melioribacter sp. OK-6-Me]|uniref:M48 family metallopeptidase n=1 Tax=unclassified Melioribacter TaxID=2627329 RepID=UPI003EDA6B95
MIKIDKLHKTNRKTVLLQILPGGKLIVRAPKNITQLELDRIILNHSNWIIKKKELLKNQFVMKKEFSEGEQFLFLGNNYTLIYSDITKNIILSDNLYINPKKKHIAEKLIQNLYRDKAKEIIRERVFYYASKFGYQFKSIRITSAKKRWGSCSYNGNLNFSWRLIMAPVDIIDYVVVHELVHLRIKNHSKVFWDKVAELMPDYYARRNWLKKNGNMLDL